MDGETGGHKYRQVDGQTTKSIHRQTDKQTQISPDRQVNIQTKGWICEQEGKARQGRQAGRVCRDACRAGT